MNDNQQSLEKTFTSTPWLDGQPAKIVHLENKNGVTASFMDIGATWLSCVLPINETQNQGREVLLRSKNMAEHIKQTAYFGSAVGRYANRIAKGVFELNNQHYQIPQNNGENSLHGGDVGFDKKRWVIKEQTSASVTFELVSPDGEQGYPGNATVEVNYQLTDDNTVIINYQASCDQDCPINLTNHAYFNLAGEGSDAKSLDHHLQMDVAAYLPTHDDLIPTGEKRSVKATNFDFSQEKPIGQDFMQDGDQAIAGGYDHAFIFDTDLSKGQACDGQPLNNQQALVTLRSPNKDVTMLVATTKPAIQFYSGNFLDNTPGATKRYQKYHGLALETQYLPDGPNHPEWGKSSGVLKAGEQYQHTTSYQFVF